MTFLKELLMKLHLVLLLCFYSQCFEIMGFRLWGEKKQIVKEDYDILIGLDSIFDLHMNSSSEGWEVLYSGKEKWEKMIGSTDNNVVAVVGGFNAGKTWVINNIANREFEEGFAYHTRGVSIKFMEQESGINTLFLDTAGVHTPVAFHYRGEKDGAATDESGIVNLNRLKTSTEQFHYEFIVSVADAVVVVVGMLTLQDQLLLERLKINLEKESEIGSNSVEGFGGVTGKRGKSRRGKHVYIIHNWKKLGTSKLVEQQIERDIQNSFHGVKKLEVCSRTYENKCTGTKFFKYKSDHFEHFVTADNSDSYIRQKFNVPVFEYLGNLLNTIAHNGQPFDIVTSTKDFTKTNLKNHIRPDCDTCRDIHYEDIILEEHFVSEDQLVLRIKNEEEKNFQARTILRDVVGNPQYGTEVDKYDPKYSLYYLNENTLIHKLDIPDLDPQSIVCKTEQNEKGSLITISANRFDRSSKKERTHWEREGSGRKFGVFNKRFQVPDILQISEYDQNHDCSCRTCYLDGVLSIQNYVQLTECIPGMSNSPLKC